MDLFMKSTRELLLIKDYLHYSLIRVQDGKLSGQEVFKEKQRLFPNIFAKDFGQDRNGGQMAHPVK